MYHNLSREPAGAVDYRGEQVLSQCRVEAEGLSTSEL